MTLAVPDHFALYALGSGFLLALGVVAWGVYGLVRRALAFKKKLEPFKRLPFAPVLELTEARVAIASRSIDRASILVTRANRACAAIGAARDEVVASALEARKFLFAMLIGG